MVWEREVIGDCTLYRGDARDLLDEITVVDALITDPPFGVVLRQKNICQGPSLGSGIRRKISAHYASYADTFAQQEEVVQPVIRGWLSRVRCAALIVGFRALWTYPPADDMGCLYNATAPSRSRWGFACMTPILYYGTCPLQMTKRGCYPTSLHTSANDITHCGHPCERSPRQMRWLVGRASLEGDLVLDPFMGSGTTGVACLALGRRFVGIEIEERYFQIACQRLTSACQQLALFAQPRPLPVQECLAL
jgi:hypothetical protein